MINIKSLAVCATLSLAAANAASAAPFVHNSFEDSDKDARGKGGYSLEVTGGNTVFKAFVSCWQKGPGGTGRSYYKVAIIENGTEKVLKELGGSCTKGGPADGGTSHDSRDFRYTFLGMTKADFSGKYGVVEIFNVKGKTWSDQASEFITKTMGDLIEQNKLGALFANPGLVKALAGGFVGKYVKIK